MLNSIILTFLSIPSILAALSRKDMATALIAAKDIGTLEKTFKKYEEEQGHSYLSGALADVAKVQAHWPKVLECLRMAHDSFPKDEMCVSGLVNSTLFKLSDGTDTESFTNVITSFKPSDIKLLTIIRFRTFIRPDALDVLKRVMDKYPELITDALPSWIAFHSLDQNSRFYSSFHEEAFQYLTSFATEDVLAKALSIVKRNEHYMVESDVVCCKSQDNFPQDLAGRIEALLVLVKARNARIREVLTFLPTVLVDLILKYTTYDIPPNCSNSSPEIVL